MLLRLSLFACLAWSVSTLSAQTYSDFDLPPFSYWEKPPQDPFTKLKDQLGSGQVKLDHSAPKAYLLSLLAALDVPVSSQSMVISATSLQSRLINPTNPRAIYFNEETYVGYVPGGRMEIASMDPELGMVFYIFDPPRTPAQPLFDRSRRCMGCHADTYTKHLPGLMIESIVPNMEGGSLNAFRRDQSGHTIPLDQRFAGWHVTGAPNLIGSSANLVGEPGRNGLTYRARQPGELFDLDHYPLPTSDILPQLLHEHQVGFVNRVLEASYRVKLALNQSNGRLDAAGETMLDHQADLLVRYLLFMDEAALPKGGVKGEAPFIRDFQRNKKATTAGISLKDFDLQTHLFKHRCSYMIYSAQWVALPTVLKQRVYAKLGQALADNNTIADYAYLSLVERRNIRSILQQTLKDLPSSWR
ncbi:hypothetical protein BH11VER1_BH11VER1_05230 [soil metagenome]